MPNAKLGRKLRSSQRSKRSVKRRVRSPKNSREPSPIASLRARVWGTAFEWARRDLRADNATAREIADAGVANL